MKLAVGIYVDYPKLLIGSKGAMQCPVCNMTWGKKGSGYGFVKRGASIHVANCFEQYLAKNGYEMQQPYSMKRLGWKLVKLQKLPKDVLHITLKKVWFDMILSGEKKEEYREIKPYWIVRICKKEFHNVSVPVLLKFYKAGQQIFKDNYLFVEAKNGYNSIAPAWKKKLVNISIGKGKSEWGGGDKLVFIITLGKTSLRTNC